SGRIPCLAPGKVSSVGRNISQIGKNDSFQRRPYREPPLQALLQKSHTPFRVSLGVKGPELLVGIASHAISAAQKKPLKNRDLSSALKGLYSSIFQPRRQRAEVQYRKIPSAIHCELKVINLGTERRSGPFHILQNPPAVFGIHYRIDLVPGVARNEGGYIICLVLLVR